MSWYRELGILELSLIILFISFYIFYLARIRKIAIALHTNSRRVFFKLVIRSIYFSLIVMAILGPSFGESRKEIKTVGKDIYIAVDLSLSMNAEDLSPSRLKKIKYELKKFVETFYSDRIGLIIFSSEAFVQCPLTYDRSALSLFIETLDPKLVSSSSTDFAPALRTALEKIQSESSTEKKQSKVIVLISDGEDFGEEYREVAQEIKDQEIKVFTVGVGTAEGGRIPYRNGYKRDQTGREVLTKLNAASLQEIAEITQGNYYEVSDQQNEFPKLIQAVSRIEGELKETRQLDVSANKYFYFVFIALIFIILDILVTVKTVNI